MTDVRVAREAVRVTSLPAPDVRAARFAVRTTSLPSPDVRIARAAVRATICLAPQTIAFVNDTFNTGTDSNPVVDVPTGTAKDQIAWLDLWIDSTSTDAQATIAAGIPAGFTIAAQVGLSNQGNRGWLFSCWKRLTGADIGTYAFSPITPDASTSWSVSCRLYSGVVKYGTPFIATPGAGISASSGTNVGFVSGTTVHVSGQVLISAMGTQTSTAKTWWVPEGFVERRDTNHLVTADKIGNLIGATPSLTYYMSISTARYPKGYVYALLPDRYVNRLGETMGAPASAAAFSVPLPTHENKARILIVLAGKPDTMTTPTIDQGFTLVKVGTGGTGAAGADTGPLKICVYAKDATSSSETDPTITPGASAPNTWIYTVASYSLPPDRAWRDAIGSDVSWVTIGDDTATAVPFTATVTMAATLADRDALMVVGAIPTDVASAYQNTSIITGVGLSQGIQDVSTSGTPQHYGETALGNDAAMFFQDWLCPTDGEVTGSVTASFSAVSLATAAGPMAFIALRQTDPPAAPEPHAVTNKDGVAIQFKHTDGNWYPLQTPA